MVRTTAKPTLPSTGEEPSTDLSLDDYRVLAEFRYQIRRFLSFSEHAARSVGLEPQQHQLLLACKGLPPDRRPTIGTLAERLCVQHHTAVALIDKLARLRLVRRVQDDRDGRFVLIEITVAGERVLRELSALHRQQLASVGPHLLRALASLRPADAAKTPSIDRSVL